jgi:hypothetical protein
VALLGVVCANLHFYSGRHSTFWLFLEVVMSVHVSGREAHGGNGSEAAPPLRLLERPPARSPRPSASAPAPAGRAPWLAWARRRLGWAEPAASPGAQEGQDAGAHR